MRATIEAVLRIVILLLSILMICAAILIPHERPPDDVDCIITLQQGRMVILRPGGDDK